MDKDTGRSPAVNKCRLRRVWRASLPLVGLATIGLLAAACGSGSKVLGVPSAGGTTTTVAPSGSSGSGASGETSQSQELQFAQCMRSHGVAGFPDPSATVGQLQNIANSGVNTQFAHLPGGRDSL